MDPITFRWDGDALTPLTPRWAKQCDKVLVVGQVYRMAPVEERSLASHRSYFASINEAFDNLPEFLGQRFKNADALRKYALIKANYCDTRTITCSSKAEAERVAAFVGQIDAYAVVAVSRNVVTVYTAHSQDMRSMDKRTFQKSKDDVMNVLAGMLGVTSEQLTAARAA